MRPIGRDVKGWVKPKLKLKFLSNLKCAGVFHPIAFRGAPCCAVVQRKEEGVMIRAISVTWFGSVRISTRARLTKTVTIWAEEAPSARLIIISVQQ